MHKEHRKLRHLLSFMKCCPRYGVGVKGPPYIFRDSYPLVVTKLMEAEGASLKELAGYYLS